MSQTTTAPTAEPKARGFGSLPCPRCGEENAGMSMALADLSDAEAVKCQECEAVFGLDEMRDLVSRWSKVLAWIDLAPTLED